MFTLTKFMGGSSGKWLRCLKTVEHLTEIQTYF